MSIWVGIVGVGQTKFGSLPDSSARELVADAFKEQAPYILGLGQLSEGPKTFAWIDKKIPEGQITIGMKLPLKSSKMADGNLTHFLTEHDLELATWFSSLMVVNDIRGDFSFGVVPSDRMTVRSTISAASWQIFVV